VVERLQPAKTAGNVSDSPPWSTPGERPLPAVFSGNEGVDLMSISKATVRAVGDAFFNWVEIKTGGWLRFEIEMLRRLWDANGTDEICAILTAMGFTITTP
jgi:hypothetical protein